MNSLPSGFERRRAQRITAEQDFRNTSWAYSELGLLKSFFRKRYSASIVDLSVTGLGIITNEEVELGSNIDLLVCFKDFKPFSVSCRSRSCRVFDRTEVNGKEMIYYKVGLQLELCSHEAMNCVKKIVHRIGVRSIADS